jgi:hypothetical protein
MNEWLIFALKQGVSRKSTVQSAFFTERLIGVFVVLCAFNRLYDDYLINGWSLLNDL